MWYIRPPDCTVYPKKYAHSFVVLCFVVVMQSFIINSHEVFIHIHQGCFAGTGAIVRLPQCQWSKHDGYGKISQCITTTKHSKAKTVCIFLGIYCIRPGDCKWLRVDPRKSIVVANLCPQCMWYQGPGSTLTHWGQDKMAAISQTTLSNSFSWMKIFQFRIKFDWSLFLRFQFTIFQHWFRWWLGAGQATSHYLNQWWSVYWRIYASLGLNELTHWFLGNLNGILDQ